MRKLLVLMLLACMSAHAQEPAQVMLFGTFHFQDAGKDLVKVKDIDISTEESQQYLEALTDRMAAFRPTVVLLEYNPKSEEAINERFRSYLNDEFVLPANEIYQLGFRIAKKAGLDRVHSFDNRDVPWMLQPVMDMAETQEVPEVVAMQTLIQKVVADETHARATMSLPQLLARQNDPDNDILNMGSYLLTNSVGAGEGFEGADATASWWQRNFRMYGIVQKHAQAGERVIAIGGSGHMAILKHLLSLDSERESVAVLPLIEREN